MSVKYPGYFVRSVSRVLEIRSKARNVEKNFTAKKKIIIIQFRIPFPINFFREYSTCFAPDPIFVTEPCV